jgi:Family of unknown function (DUF6519)
VGGDFTRLTFQPDRDYNRVRMQQGRVQLDSDWNEQADIVERRLRAATLDIVGRATVPAETPDGFRITLDGGGLRIGRGRLYLDGMLVENHGGPVDPGDARLDRHLGELVGTGTIDYGEQPYRPVPAVVPDSGTWIVYLEAWEREVTAVQEPDLVEPALGVDTATRVQTAWQVGLLPVTGDRPAPGNVEGLPTWRRLVEPPAGRLSTFAVGRSQVGGQGSYTGGANRLQRVEIHDSGGAGRGATFKWSSVNDCGTVSVREISPDRTRIYVAGARRGASFAFEPGDWVELLDDRVELRDDRDEANARHGLMVKVDSVDAVAGVLTLTERLTDDDHPFNPELRELHTRLRRWEQRGPDVDDGGGVIPVPADDTPVPLADGMEVSFTAVQDADADDDRAYRAGDHWQFTVRADGSWERLRQAPPRGVLRHHCPLAIVELPNGAVDDLRQLWRPRTGTDDDRGSADGSAVSVSADGHANRLLTVQEAIDRVRGSGGAVRLGPGTYWLDDPLSLDDARSVRLSGVGPATVLVYRGEEAALSIARARSVTVEDLTIIAVAMDDDEGEGHRLRLLVEQRLGEAVSEVWSALDEAIERHRRRHVTAVGVRGSAEVCLQRCAVIQVAQPDSRAAAIALHGTVVGTTIQDNRVFGIVGIGGHDRAGRDGDDEEETNRRPGSLVTAGLRVERNELRCTRRGIDLDGRTLHAAETRITGNHVHGCEEVGIAVAGFLQAGQTQHEHGQRLVIESNSVQVSGEGIAISADRARVAGNDVTVTGDAKVEGHAAGIHVRVAPACEVEVADNTVRVGPRPDHERVPGPCGSWS